MVNHQVVEWLWEHALKFNMCKLLSVIGTEVGQTVPNIPNRDLLLSYSFCSHILDDKSEWKYTNMDNLSILKEILESVTQRLQGIFQHMDRMHYVKLISSVKFLIVLKSMVTQSTEETKQLLLSYFPSIGDDVWQEIKKDLQYEDDSMRSNHENSNKLARDYFIQKLHLSSVGKQFDTISTVKTVSAVVEPLLPEFTKILRNHLQPTAVELISNSAHDDLSMSDDTKVQLLLSEIQNGPSEDRLLGVFRTIKSSTLTSFPEKETSELERCSSHIPLQEDLKQNSNYSQLPLQSSVKQVYAGKEVVNSTSDWLAAETETCVLKNKTELFKRPEHCLADHNISNDSYKVSQSDSAMKVETKTHNQTKQQCCRLKRFPGCIYRAGWKIRVKNVGGCLWDKEQMKKQIAEKKLGEACQVTAETLENIEKENVVAETHCRSDSVEIPNFIDELSGFLQKLRKFNMSIVADFDDLPELITTMELLLNKLKSLQEKKVLSEALSSVSDPVHEAVIKEGNRADNEVKADPFFKQPSPPCVSTVPRMQENQNNGGKHQYDHKSYDTESICCNKNENWNSEIVHEAKMKEAVTTEKTAEAVSLSVQSSASCVSTPQSREENHSIANNQPGNNVHVHEKNCSNGDESEMNLQLETISPCTDCGNKAVVDTDELENVEKLVERDNVKRKNIKGSPQLIKQTRSVTQKMKRDKLKRKRTVSSNMQLIKHTRNATQRQKRDKVKVKRKITQNDSNKQLIRQTRNVTRRIRQVAVQSKGKASDVDSKKLLSKQNRNLNRKKNGIQQSGQRLKNDKGEKLEKRVSSVVNHSNSEHSNIFSESDTEVKWFSAEEDDEQNKTNNTDHQNQNETDAVKTKKECYNNYRSETTKICEVTNVIVKDIFPASEEGIVQKDEKNLDGHCSLPLPVMVQICADQTPPEEKAGSAYVKLESSSCDVSNRDFEEDIVDTVKKKKRYMHLKEDREESCVKRFRGREMENVKESVQYRETKENEESVAVEEFQFQQCALTGRASWGQENAEVKQSQVQTNEEEEGIGQDPAIPQLDETIVTASPAHSEDSGKMRSPFILYMPFVQPCLIRLFHEGEMHIQDEQLYPIYH